MGVHVDQTGDDDLSPEIQDLHVGGRALSSALSGAVQLPAASGDLSIFNHQVPNPIRFPEGVYHPAAFE
jgi:hypothetical protein